MTVTEATERLLAAGSDDEAITLATVDLVVANYSEEQQEQLRAAVFAAAIPHWFDGTVLSRLLAITPEEAQGVFSELKNFSFVERHLPRDAWNIHERSRRHLRASFFREQSDTYRQFSKRAAEFFHDTSKPHMQVEWMFHLLVAEPELGSQKLAHQYDEWNGQGRVELLQALAGVLDEHLKENQLASRPLAMVLDVVASIEWSYRPLAETETRLRKALTIYRDLHDQRSESVILDEIGDLQRDQGHLEDALDSFQASLSIREKRAADYPDNADRQRDLSVSHSKVGTVHRFLGRLKDALNSFQASLSIREKLATDYPDNLERQRDLSISHDSIGMVQVAQEQLEDALRSFQASLNIAERLAAHDPDNTQWQRDLFVSYTKVSEVQQLQGHSEDALRSALAARRITEKLTAYDPNNAQWQRDLSISHSNIGVAQRAQGQLEDALKSFQASLSIREKLAAHDPDNTEWQRDLSISYNMIGKVQLTQGHLEDALHAFQSSLRITEKLTAHDPRNTQWQRDLEISRRYMAEVTEAGRLRQDLST